MKSLSRFHFFRLVFDAFQRRRMPAPPLTTSARSSRAVVASAAADVAPVCASAEFLPAAAALRAAGGGKENAAEGDGFATANANVVVSAASPPHRGAKRAAEAQHVVSVCSARSKALERSWRSSARREKKRQSLAVSCFIGFSKFVPPVLSPLNSLSLMLSRALFFTNYAGRGGPERGASIQAPRDGARRGSRGVELQRL